MADLVSLGISLGAFLLAALGHLTENLQDVAYLVSISAGLFTIMFGYLNYRLNKKKNGTPKRKFKR